MELGFSHEEAKIYLSLLELGQTTAGPIVKKAGLHRQVVYDTLEKLKTKDLVLETSKSNRKNWIASSPAQITHQIRKKETLAKELLPDLFSIYKLSSNKQEVRIFEGLDGFRNVHENNIENEKNHSNVLIIGSTGWDWVETMKKAKYFEKFEKKRIKKDITLKIAFFEKERKKTKKLVETFFENHPQQKKRIYKFLPDQFESPVGIQIWKDNITLIIYSENVLCIQIKNSLVAENFKKYFEFIWKIAKK